MNTTYKILIYSEGDKIALEFLGVLIYVFIEILFYSQEIPIIENRIANLIYLSYSKIAIVSFFLAIEHSRYLKNEHYKTSLHGYFNLTSPERRVVLNPTAIIVITYLNSILLNTPLYFGQQVLSGVKFTILLLVNTLVFYVVFRLLFKKTWNYLAVVLLAERTEEMRAFPNIEKHVITKRWIILLILCVLPGLTLLFVKPKLFIFGFFIACFSVLVFVTLHALIYLLGLAVSIIRAKYKNLNIPDIRLDFVVRYLGNTLKSIGVSYIPIAAIMFFTFSLLSLFPKHFEYQNPDLVNAIVDKSGHPIYIEEAPLNRSIGIPASNVDTLFFKLLFTQEDRQFLSQNSLLPQLSNWHGLCFSSFRVFSGASGSSNLNNQLIKNLAYRHFPQDISRKFSEAIASYELSIQLQPAELANFYVNSVGFTGGIGGNEGLLACSMKIFNQPVEELNPLELFYLVRTLTRGEDYRTRSGILIPYSEVEGHEAKIKQDLLLIAKLWQDKDLLTKKDVSRLRRCELRFSNSASETKIATTTKEFLKKQLPSSLNKKTYFSSITADNQERLENGVRKFEDQFREYKRSGSYDLYTAAIALDVKTGRIIGQYGGQGVTDLTTINPGMPMASLIKPFVLLEMLQEGRKINLFDGKIAGKKTPENFNHKYLNRFVGVQEILTNSLNAPIVNIREVTSPIDLFSHVENRFKSMELQKDPFLQIEDQRRKQEIEFNYGLGSRVMRLIDIAQAYQTLINDGKYVKLNAIQSAFNPNTNMIEHLDSLKSRQIYSSENVRIIKEALTHTIDGTASTIKPLLPRDNVFYIKTGTADRAIHGYCMLSDGNLLIISFLSYGKIVDGRLELNNTPAIPLKSGGRTATVLAAMIYNQLQTKK
jgi:membrane peptidoglycan carboxypeptidase